jgi:LPXTG-motif cell wall-anchored protein
MPASLSPRTIRIAVLSLVTIVLLTCVPLIAQAAIPGVSATIEDPDPNPVPAGGTASTSAQFNFPADLDPLMVTIELQGPAGFGVLRLDPAGTTTGLTGCVESGTTVTCDWVWDGVSLTSQETLAVFIDVDASVPPNSGANLVAIVSSVAIPDTDTYANINLFTSPPLGTTTLSGTVVTEGGIPVENACIFVLSSPLFVFQTITDSAGNWALDSLPDTWSYAVAAVAPFVGSFGPCAENGPPPIPGPGDLQGVFYDEIWIDLSDPLLTGGLGDPYVFAVNAGATVLTSSTAGIQSCLSTAPADAIPRPPCIAAVTTTTADVGGGSVTTTTLADTLPLTGSNPSALLAVGSLLILLGVAGVMGARRSRGSQDS